MRPSLRRRNADDDRGCRVSGDGPGHSVIDDDEDDRCDGDGGDVDDVEDDDGDDDDDDDVYGNGADGRGRSIVADRTSGWPFSHVGGHDTDCDDDGSGGGGGPTCGRRDGRATTTASPDRTVPVRPDRPVLGNPVALKPTSDTIIISRADPIIVDWKTVYSRNTVPNRSNRLARYRRQQLNDRARDPGCHRRWWPGPMNRTECQTLRDSLVWRDAQLLGALVGLSFIALIVTVGNTLVVAAVFNSSKLRSPTNTFIVSLAVSDLMVGVAVLPFSATWEVFKVNATLSLLLFNTE